MSDVREAPMSDYDEFVDWGKRLDREGPFFKRLFEEVGVARVIDVGAGSARHAIMFATWGLDVMAIDPDESMLGAARANAQHFADDVARGGGSLRIANGGFGGVAALDPGVADALTCTGNALPHVGGRERLARTLEDFAAVLRPGGVLVLHLLNHQRLLDSQVRAVPPKVVDTAQGTKVFLRVINYPEGGEYLDFDFVTMMRDGSGEWSLESRRSLHTALPVSVLREALVAAGFESVEALGGHDGHAMTAQDESVIVVARRS